MALEYMAKFFIYLIVIIVIVGLMIRFFMGKKICFFDCVEDEKLCEVKTLVIDEYEITSETLNKYCYLCWEKNNLGECKENVLCYVINGNFYASQSYVLSDPEHCELRCDRDATSLLFLYDYLRGKVFIEC